MTKSLITAELLKRYLESDLSEEETILVEKWYTQLTTKDEEVENSFDQQKHFNAVKQKLAYVEGSKENIREETNSVLFHPIRNWWYAAAAIVVLALGSWWGYSSFLTTKESLALHESKKMVILSNTTKKVVSYQLPDSSYVWLNPGAELKFDTEKFESQDRNVQLIGQAFFDVQRDTKHPFQVFTMSNLVVRVLGTRFHVNATPGELQYRVEVVTGKVEIGSLLQTKDMKESVVLHPNEEALFEVASGTITTESNTPNKTSNSTWKGVTMMFNEVRLDQVALRLESKFGVKIIFKDPNLAHCRLKAEFDNQNLIEIIEAIANILDIEYEIDDNTVQLIGVGCEK